MYGIVTANLNNIESENISNTETKIFQIKQIM